MEHEDTSGGDAGERPAPLKFGPIRWVGALPEGPVDDESSNGGPSNGHGWEHADGSASWWSRPPIAMPPVSATRATGELPIADVDLDDTHLDDTDLDHLAGAFSADRVAEGETLDEDALRDGEHAFGLDVFDDTDDGVAERAPARVVAAPVVSRRRSSTGARFLAVVVAVVLLGLVAATVLLWQRVEDTRKSARTPRTVTVSGLAAVQRRLDQVETQLAAIRGSGTAPPLADPLQNQVTALEQCVAQFQQAVVDVQRGRRVQITYC
jgi:hypothetical protein